VPECLIVVGADTLGPVSSSAHLSVGTPSLWTAGALVDAGSSNQEWSAPKPDTAGDAQEVVEVSSRRETPRLTCPVTGFKMVRRVRRYGLPCADFWSLCNLFLHSVHVRVHHLTLEFAEGCLTPTSLIGSVFMCVRFLCLSLGLAPHDAWDRWFPSRCCAHTYSLEGTACHILVSNSAAAVVRRATAALANLGSATAKCPVAGCPQVVGASTLEKGSATRD